VSINRAIELLELKYERETSDTRKKFIKSQITILMQASQIIFYVDRI